MVADSPGFASSRLGLVLGLEAMRMVEQGVASPEDIDKAMTLGYRPPDGAVAADRPGRPRRAPGHRRVPAPGTGRARPSGRREILRRLVAEGRLGKKSGRGFYEW